MARSVEYEERTVVISVRALLCMMLGLVIYPESASALRIEKEWPLRPGGDTVTVYLQNLGARLLPSDQSWRRWVSAYDWPQTGWRFLTVRDLSVNAFSVGDGRIYITDGTFNFVRSEAELAAIVAHEMGHQLAGHFCGNPASAGSTRQQVGTILQVLDSKKEIEADSQALEILVAAGIPAGALLDVIKRLPITGNAGQHELRLRKLTEKLAVSNYSGKNFSSAEFENIKKLLSY